MLILTFYGRTNPMTLDFSDLKTASRLLIEAKLEPMQGQRFQPTGFPDLDAATYKLPQSSQAEAEVPMLLVESAQSVANRLETTIWDSLNHCLIEPLQGISYVEVRRNDEVLTNSLLEAHRLNSFYILEGKDKSFFERLKQELDVEEEGAVSYANFMRTLAKYDLNSLLHGVFLAKKEIAGGRFRLARALSGFIEASNVREVMLGGVKNDRVNPKADAKKGGGNIPYHRSEYVAETITAFFNLDLNQIAAYPLPESVKELLIAIALYKIQQFLATGLRLRTACDLGCRELRVTRPTGATLPSLDEVRAALPELVQAAAADKVFADPAVTVVSYEAS